MSGLSELRARRALKEAGLDADCVLEQASSVTNEVWLTPTHVVRLNREPDQRLHREAAVSRKLPAAVGYPGVVARGGDLGADWVIVARIPGEPLSRSWPDMDRYQRRRATAELAARLRLVHATTAPSVLELHRVPQLLDSAPTGADATARLCQALVEAGHLPFVDSGMMLELSDLVGRTATALDPFDAPTLVHGDLTFENVLWDGEHVTGILDFEWARSGPPDLDLDVVLRFCAYPALHVAADYEDRTHAQDYAEVPWWLAEDYPELFSHPRAFERLRTYSIAWDVLELLKFPPKRPLASLPDGHPANRLLRTLRGTSHLDVLNGSVAGVA